MENIAVLGKAENVGLMTEGHISREETLARTLASAIDAQARCIENDNTLWEDRWREHIRGLIEYLPHGCGIDGTTILDDESNGEKIIIRSSYHAMDEHGGYDGWYDFTITVTGSLIHGLDIDIEGDFGEYEDCLDYLAETFDWAFSDKKSLLEWQNVSGLTKYIKEGGTG